MTLGLPFPILFICSASCRDAYIPRMQHTVSHSLRHEDKLTEPDRISNELMHSVRLREAFSLALITGLLDEALTATLSPSTSTYIMLTPESTPEPTLGLDNRSVEHQHQSPQSILFALMVQRIGYYWRVSQVLLRLLCQAGALQVLLLLTLVGHSAQRGWLPLEATGARVASLIQEGEVHRLVTPLFLHSGLLHLVRTCVFGIARLMPATVALYGETQAILLYLIAGVGGNFASLAVGSSGEVPSVGASAAVLGLEGALLACSLRNERTARSALRLAMRRIAVTVAACSSLALHGRAGRVDHAAHAGGFISGLFLGLLLAPRVRPAIHSFRQHVLDEMCEAVAIQSASSDPTQLIASYLRRVPAATRAETLLRWELEQLNGPEAPLPTERWPLVWRLYKEHAANLTRPRDASVRASPAHDIVCADSTDDCDSKSPVANVSRQSRDCLAGSHRAQPSLSFAQEHRLRAEAAVLKHFHERASLAQLYMRVLQRPVSLRQLRRARFGVGAFLPRVVAESLAGVVMVWALWSCYEAVTLALQLQLGSK
mmetsp:Transcript_18165/g.30360  ORF Transcript_18165/g.30360 Transcript_18165/m.30360 type:complete len:544 (+) Transcript_18165:279-1910(+)|eukprot:CAMPEP_0119341742 /NCGR_PEP_ID=MMETSP1333-20130426/103139_1 /TAXON_ID=418940 /ORGANISM="Scyphosphaera apsteinii, Strain RCC1455" /LENGTH=543 /DNA_ID=CAMNT_0007353795 /DNA_START=272 /DNA_END=1903 /DNA_ORIENTATION=+